MCVCAFVCVCMYMCVMKLIEESNILLIYEYLVFRPIMQINDLTEIISSNGRGRFIAKGIRPPPRSHVPVCIATTKYDTWILIAVIT